MCVSMAPADFSGTTVLSYNTYHSKLGWIRVMGYQNKVLNRATNEVESPFGWSVRPKPRMPLGNAMILHLDAVEGLGSENVIPTDDVPNILDDMVEALSPKYRSLGWEVTRGVSKGVEIQVFESGIYTVVLAQGAKVDQIVEALGSVPEEKRPAIKPDLFDFYLAQYPDFPLAICCFNTTQEVKATPMLWWYRPLRWDLMMAPGLDCHTGEVPDLGESVGRDHWVVMATDNMRGGFRVDYQDPIPDEMSTFLPTSVVGKRWNGPTINGDFLLTTEAVSLGRVELMQVAPPPGKGGVLV